MSEQTKGEEKKINNVASGGMAIVWWPPVFAQVEDMLNFKDTHRTRTQWLIDARQKKKYSSACFIFKIPFMQVEMMAGPIYRNNCAEFVRQFTNPGSVALELEVFYGQNIFNR